MAYDALEVAHPLEQITAWMADKPEETIEVGELYNDGPDRLGISEKEFREWINEGFRYPPLFKFTQLTGALTLTGAELPRSLPQSPSEPLGGY